MTPLFHPALVNGPTGDPALFIDFLFQRRALLFDLGDISALPARKILRVSHVFITHAHMDHFIGLDHLVRIFLGREKKIHLFGPPRLVQQVRGRLQGYTWNLVQGYPTDFTVAVIELHPDGSGRRAEFHCRDGFSGTGVEVMRFDAGVLLDEESFRIRGRFLDHGVPCLGFSLEEKAHVSVMKNRLEEKGLLTGPWLAELKRGVLQEKPEATLLRVPHRTEDGVAERMVPLEELKREVVRVGRGQKISYVTDVRYTEENAEGIVDLCRGSDYLFIEAPFLHRDSGQAARKCHLTARQAGMLGRASGSDRVIASHFSPRYSGMEEALQRELEEALQGREAVVCGDETV